MSRLMPYDRAKREPTLSEQVAADRKREIQSARLEAARRVRDAIGYGLQCAAKKATCEAGEEVLRIFTDDELARIIGDAPAGEVMPSVPTDHPVRDSRPGEYVAVGEEVSGVSTVNAEANPSASRDDQPSAPVRDPAKEAEPPRPDPAEPHKCQRNGCKACWDNGYDNGSFFIIGCMIGDLQRHGFDAAAKHLYARYNPSAIGQTMEEDTNV